MTAAIATSVADIERFRSAVRKRMGLHLDDTRVDTLGTLLQQRAKASGGSIAGYLATLEGRESLRDELAELAPHLTVSETYFFRHRDQLRAFTEVALPARFAVRSAASIGARRLSLLSAGCSSGDEAFSLAILARESMPDPGWQVSVRGVDINPVILQKAARGRYAPWALRETSAEQRDRWFHSERGEMVLDRSIHRAVTFEQRNLVHENADLWLAESYDVVFCRNMLMYFSAEHASALVGRIARALAPGGYLFLGHAETLRGLSHDFHLRHTHETFYYQRKSTLGDSAVDSEGEALHVPPRWAEPAPPVVGGNAQWISAIAQASQRIDALRDQLTTLDRVEPISKPDAEAVLLRAALLTHRGQHEQGERACRELLALDELSAGAHYLMGLCREGVGDAAGALEHYRTATYLDPGFGMPRLHLGLLASQSADRESARRELGQALSLLQREDAARILLFGGGFSREALLTLCRSQLLACGVKA